jgi:hypothetical protein
VGTHEERKYTYRHMMGKKLVEMNHFGEQGIDLMMILVEMMMDTSIP